jgi:hypothetical protein
LRERERERGEMRAAIREGCGFLRKGGRREVAEAPVCVYKFENERYDGKPAARMMRGLERNQRTTLRKAWERKGL